MKRTLITTSDGSHTLYIPEWDETYHSRYGAVQESYHVFIQNGLYLFENEKIAILEIGFGTGLNTLLTYKEHAHRNLQIDCIAVEAYPVAPDEVAMMNYASKLQEVDLQYVYQQMHTAAWEKEIRLSETFTLTKRKQFFEEIDDENAYDLIYFDAFGAEVQPELWTEAMFQKMYKALKNRGVLVTYAAKGSVRRAMLSCGFRVERLPGPPGKREMLRATKP